MDLSAHNPTKACLIVRKQIEQFLNNPVQGIRQVRAVRAETSQLEGNNVARKLSAAQKAALARGRAKRAANLKKNPAKLAENPRRGSRRAKRTTRRGRKALASNAWEGDSARHTRVAHKGWRDYGHPSRAEPGVFPKAKREYRRRHGTSLPAGAYMEAEEEMALQENARRGRRGGGRKRRRRASSGGSRGRARTRTASRRRSGGRGRSSSSRRRTSSRRRGGGTRRRDELLQLLENARRGGGRKRRRSSGRRRSTGRRRGRRLNSNPSTHVVMLPNPMGGSRKRRRRRRREMGLFGNPSRRMRGGRGRSFLGLFENPLGPFNRRALTAYGSATAGVVIGLLGADLIDRYVATRKPADAGSVPANHPWFGRDAAAAYRRRPDAMRLGVQAGGAVLSMAGAYFTRGRGIFPWLLGGLAVGFGANLGKMLADWYLMPALFKVDPNNPGEQTLANRLYPLEQSYVQDAIDQLFENWNTTATLSEAQAETPIIQGPLGDASTSAGSAYALGKARSPQTLAHSRRRFVRNSTVGMCDSCGGYQGHWTDCGDYCPDCPGNEPPCPDPDPNCPDPLGTSNPRCCYTVATGDDLRAIVSQATGSTPDSTTVQSVIEKINSLNGSGPDTYWVTGNRVILPFEVCRYLEVNTPEEACATDGGLQPSLPEFPSNGSATPAFPEQECPAGMMWSEDLMQCVPIPQNIQGVPENKVKEVIPEPIIAKSKPDLVSLFHGASDE